MGRPTTTDEIITLHRSTMLSNKHNAMTSTSINELLSRSSNLEITLSQTVATPANFRDCNAQLNDIRQHIRDVNNSLESLLNLLLADASVDVPTISKTSTVTHSTTQSIEGSKAESLFDSPKKGSIDSTSHSSATVGASTKSALMKSKINPRKSSSSSRSISSMQRKTPALDLGSKVESVDVPTISKTSIVTHSTTPSIQGSKAESLFDSPKKGSIDSTSHDNQRDTDNDLPSIRNDLATVRNAQVDIDSSVVELTRMEEIYIPKKILYR